MGLTKTSDKAAGLRSIEPRAFERDLPGLLTQLAQGDDGERRWAARDLAAHAEAAPALCERLVHEPDASVCAVIFTSLARIGTADVVHGLLPLLRSEDAALRNGAIEVLAGLPDAVAPSVDALLADEDGDVRIFTVNLLGDLRHPLVPQWLSQVLARDEAVNVVGAALEVAAEAAGPDMKPALLAARARFADQPYIVFAADLALERIEAA